MADSHDHDHSHDHGHSHDHSHDHGGAAGGSFDFDGQAISAQAGQTIAGALHASGQTIVSRSFKYHRPRGLFCMTGRCPNCMCTVDGTPNVRICTTTAKAGMQVQSQNAWPSLKFDLLSIFDKLHKFMPVGFYYKIMHKPRWAWPLFEKVVRRIAGLGKIDLRHGGDGIYDKLNLFSDVAVVGGGLAGLNAALAAAEAGSTVTLIDDQTELGGHVRHDPELTPADLVGLIAKVKQNANIKILSGATVFGVYEENYLGIQLGKRMIRLRAQQVVVASGGWERPLVFENNDLPGVMLASAAQRLVFLEKTTLQGKAVIVTDNAQGYRAARQLAAKGTTIAAIIDVRPTSSDSYSGATVHRGYTIRSADGVDKVAGATIEAVTGGGIQKIPCQWIVQAVGFTPASSLLYQNGCKLKYDEKVDHPVVVKYSKATASAGAVNGMHDPAGAALEGKRAGLAAASALQPENTALAGELASLTAECTALEAKRTGGCGHYCSDSTAKKKFVCLCEDVTEKDVRDAVTEGYSNIETLKRYSTVSMGPCQGKMCQSASIALCAKANGLSIEETGVTTARPPEVSLPLGVLAGRTPHFSLTRRTPMHSWHELHGGKMGDAGNWKRPQVYTSIQEEYDAVRKRAGLIDVSTLGKLEFRGKDVVKLLEFIYPNRFDSLKVGRVRYGVICDDSGIILDDGTIGRLGDERFFLTTTTGNADAIDSWFRWWLAAKPELDVQMTNVSGSYAAMNLAGPKSREILAKLTDADLSTAAMPYLAAAQAKVAGVPAIILRIGFVGELGYEIHVPSQYGLHVWEAILQAGRDFGIAPFGLEAQRLLRLEKKHFLPGVDTDALSNPFEADLPWIVKLDKPDFIGKRSLERAHQRGDRQKLVAFKMSGNNPPELASLVIHNGQLGGRVTSSSYSPAAGSAVGLAWVPASQSKNGDQIQIQVNGQLVTAVVHDEPFYDPEGLKLKS